MVLESLYNGVLQLPVQPGGRLSPDPHDWGWFAWLTQLGPLLGFGYLAGATLDLPDEPTSHRGPRAWLRRRSVWVALGPWGGFVVWSALLWIYLNVHPFLPTATTEWIHELVPGARASPSGFQTIVFWVLFVLVVTTLCYGWLLPAHAAHRRARRSGRAGRSFARGVKVALAFVGSLIGSFWAITEGWRDFFFDPRVVPALLAALTLGVLCGCNGTITYGEVRRRELFHALLLAWTFGLALLWLWWGRPRSKPPGPPV
ncbi:MAG: hypothetical protein NVSMB9_27270 [Isosphaeraceae bacterium]